jgi:V/A-type H+/Na+-transporting ATPase subunit E
MPAVPCPWNPVPGREGAPVLIVLEKRMAMETQLKELLDKIRDEGVKEAERKAALIIEEAQAQAAALVSRARQEAETMIADAERRAAQAAARGDAALTQAGRDLLLKLREMIARLFDAVLRQELKKELDGKLLEELALKAVAAFQPAAGHGLEIQVAPADAQRLEKHLRAALARDAAQGITVKPVDAIDAGFRIGEKDGAVFHDITNTGLAEILGAFVNPHLAELIRIAAASGSAGR